MHTVGETHPIIYELRTSAMELDVILIALNAWKTEDTLFKKERDELIEHYTKLQNIRTVNGLVRYGTMDSSRLNWQ